MTPDNGIRKIPCKSDLGVLLQIDRLKSALALPNVPQQMKIMSDRPSWSPYAAPSLDQALAEHRTTWLSSGAVKVGNHTWLLGQ